MREMKDSGVEWIGEIPKSWDLNRVKFVSTYNDESLKDSCDPEAEIEYVEIGSVTLEQGVKSSETMRFKDAPSRARRIARRGDIIISTVRTYLKAIAQIETDSYIVSTGFCVIRPKESVDSRFLKYFCSSELFTDLVAAHSVGISYPAINASTLVDFHIICPPFSEQCMIADLLDEKCAHVDTLIANVQAQIEKLKAYKQSVITEAVTKGLDPTAPMKDSGVEWLGEVPAHWGIFRIANLYAERSESGLPELPILTVSINSGVSDHEIADKDKDRVFIRMEDRTKYKRVCPGDLTYNMMRAWQGAFGAVRVDGLVSPAYVVAKPKNEIPLDSRYIEALLRTPVAIEEMHRYSRGIIDFRLRLYWPEFKNIQICLPPFDEQTRIADYIDEIASKVDSLIAIKQAKIEKLEQYKRSLIYEYVTGKKEVPAQT